MAFDLKVLEDETRDVPVTIGSQTLNVVYYPNVISTQFVERMQQVEQTGDISALAEGAEKMIHDWDMVRGKEKVKPDLETLRTLGLDILGNIMSQVMENATGDAEAEKNA